jgi:peptide deformylase
MKLTNKVLYRPAKTFEDFAYPARNSFLANQIFSFMLKNNGIGRAAPQVGMSKRLFVMEVDAVQRACFNPEITGQSADLTNYPEGCLSFPGVWLQVNRSRAVMVRYQNNKGEFLLSRLEGLEARCFQHELDHLDGITFNKRVSKLKWDMAQQKANR